MLRWKSLPAARAPDKTRPGSTSPNLGDFTLAETFDHHKMATSHDGKSLLLNHGGKMKSVPQVNDHNALYKDPQKHAFKLVTEPVVGVGETMMNIDALPHVSVLHVTIYIVCCRMILYE